MSERERILLVIDTLGPGGAEHALLSLARGLQQRGHECLVVALGGPHDLAELFLQGGVPVELCHFGGYRHLPAAVRALRRVIQMYGPSAIEAHLMYSATAVALTRPWSRLAPTIAVFHNLAYTSYPVDSLKRRARRTLERLSMRHGIDACVAVSSAVAEQYADALRIRDVAVIPNAIDLDVLHQHRASESDLDGTRLASRQRFTLLCAGTFRPEKGHRFLISAVALLKRRGIPLKVVLAGDGPLRGPICQQIIDENVSESFDLVGRLPQTHLLSLMACVDALVVPSTHEGFGMTALEASILGLPVVATNVGGLPEALDSNANATLIPPASSVRLAEALERLATASPVGVGLRPELTDHKWRRFTPYTVAGAHERIIQRTARHRGAETRTL